MKVRAWATRRARWKRNLLERENERLQARRLPSNRLTPQVAFTHDECAALLASTSASCVQLEQALGRNNEAWIRMNSLRTLFAEMGYGLETLVEEEAGWTG